MKPKIHTRADPLGLIIRGLGLLALCLLLYLPHLNNPFFGDDYKYMGSDDSFQKANLFVDYFRPTRTQHYNPYNRILNEFLFRHFPLKPWPLRLFNLTLFALTAISLFYLCRLLTLNQKTAFVTAVLFCVHPLSAEMLNHVSFNIVFLFGLLVLLSFISFVIFDTTHRRLWLWASIFLFFNAQMCLEFYFILPVLLFLYIFMLKKQSFKNTLLRILPFILLTLAHLALWTFFIGHKVQFIDRMTGLNMNLVTYLASFSCLANWFLSNIILPKDIVFILNIYPLDSGLLKNLFLILFFVEIAFVLRWVFLWGKNIKSFSILWFAAGFLPTFPASLGHAYMGLVFEPYWMYISLIGLFLLFSLLMEHASSQAKVPGRAKNILTILIFLTFALVGQYYMSVAKTERDYYRHWHKKSPHNYIALCGLAETHYKAKEYDQALKYYTQAINTITNPKVRPPYKAYLDIAQIHYEQKRYSLARKFINKLIKADPQKPFAFFMLGLLAEKENNFTQAEQYYLKAIDLAPSFLKASLRLSNLYEDQGNFLKAEKILKKVLPHMLTQDAHNRVLSKLTDIYIENKNFDKLILLFENLVQRHAPNVEYHIILNQINENREYAWGLRIIDKLFAMLHDDIEYYAFKGIFQANLGQHHEAIQTWQAGKKINGTDKRLDDYINKAEKFIAMGNQKRNAE